MTPNDAVVRLADPDVTPQELADIAAEHPELRATVAAHPLAYPELLDWLAKFNDPLVKAALSSRIPAQFAVTHSYDSSPSSVRSTASKATPDPTPGTAPHVSPGISTASTEATPTRKLGTILAITLAAVLVLSCGVFLGAKLFNKDDNVSATEPLTPNDSANVVEPSDLPPFEDVFPRTQVVLSPAPHASESLQNDWAAASQEVLNKRLNALGLRGEVSTQGSDTIILTLAGEQNDEIIEQLLARALLEFRPVLYSTDPGTFDLEDSNEAHLVRFADLDCTVDDGTAEFDASTLEPQAACAQDRSAKYLLGPSEISNEFVVNATAQAQTISAGQALDTWVVTIELDAEGTARLAELTSRLAGASPFPSGFTEESNMLALVLDGVVLTASSVNDQISGGVLELSGDFSEDAAQQLASRISGSNLPVSLEIDSVATITGP